jgi:hypothetical protein
MFASAFVCAFCAPISQYTVSTWLLQWTYCLDLRSTAPSYVLGIPYDVLQMLFCISPLVHAVAIPWPGAPRHDLLESGVSSLPKAFGMYSWLNVEQKQEAVVTAHIFYCIQQLRQETEQVLCIAAFVPVSGWPAQIHDEMSNHLRR